MSTEQTPAEIPAMTPPGWGQVGTVTIIIENDTHPKE